MAEPDRRRCDGLSRHRKERKISMIKAENLSYEFPQKELYKNISFTLEDNQHCAFIGSNGTGKSTLISIIRDPEEYLFDGKLQITENSRIGYVSQFSQMDKQQESTVYEYLSERFVELQNRINDICTKMETEEELDDLLVEYQNLLDESNAIDADNYESNIKKELKLANLSRVEKLPLNSLSGGEYKLIQVIREMIVSPNLLIMDEPDVFLDFENLNALRDLINSHQGTMLVITHNRYLLNHCFDKILHLEDTDIQEFDGTYIEYNFSLLQKKIELQERAAADTAEIERNQKLVDRLRNDATRITSATRGRALHARVSLLERLEARRIKEPFVEIRQPKIRLQTENALGEETVLKITDYSVTFDEILLEHVNFEVKGNEKIALVGPNGTGKTTLLRDIYKGANSSIELGNRVELGFLSQFQGEMLDEKHTVMEEFEEFGFATAKEVQEYLNDFCFEEDIPDSRIGVLSGGEKNLLQLAKISLGNANLLLLDEPTSHLDTYAQIALENAVADYNGAILMVSHDFYTIANCMDYVLFVDGKTIRKMSIRKFRKMIYANHFDKDYLEAEQKKKELETRIARELEVNHFEEAGELSEELEKILRLF